MLRYQLESLYHNGSCLFVMKYSFELSFANLTILNAKWIQLLSGDGAELTDKRRHFLKQSPPPKYHTMSIPNMNWSARKCLTSYCPALKLDHKNLRKIEPPLDCIYIANHTTLLSYHQNKRYKYDIILVLCNLEKKQPQIHCKDRVKTVNLKWLLRLMIWICSGC